jgi:hypothetical protein
MNPDFLFTSFPVYIISKGRWELRHTSKALELCAVPYRIVIEPQEYEQYSAVIDPAKILVLPFSNLGQGSIPARNWVWEHSISEGHKRHWILDDNIRGFYRLQDNRKWKVSNGAIFKAAEDFVNRYCNIGLAGFEYEMFVPRKRTHAPFALNRRVYSCILINNAIPHRWRGRYNEDTDLSLRVLKDGDCTALFYTFLADKIATLTIKGGNTDNLYNQTNSRLEFAQSLQDQHPDCVKVVWKYNRWHHEVDYSRFKANRLIKRNDIEIPTGINNYGMKLVKRDTNG